MRKSVLEQMKAGNGNGKKGKGNSELKVSVEINSGNSNNKSKKKSSVSIPEAGKIKDVEEVNNIDKPKKKSNLRILPYKMRAIKVKPAAEKKGGKNNE